ncbi:MAG: nickel-dependent lactate racemase [Spirochaetes bacterium]|nr:nickel-dependent lactate racemase [Spirochaetota bacterium]
MKIALPWGNTALQLNLPETWEIIFPQPMCGESTKDKLKGVRKGRPHDEIALVHDSLKRPVGMVPIEKMKLKGKRICIVVDDNTRPTPVYKFFHLILHALRKAQASEKNIVVIPALGIHTKMTKEEMGAKVGEVYAKKIKWLNHDPHDATQLQYVGNTSRGVRVELNRHLVDADFIVTLGLVEPHLWAGFGGGMKNILPGLASAKTIGQHHEIIAHPPYLFNRVGMAPEMNSFRLDLEEVKGMLAAPVFCLNVVLDFQKRIIGAFAGDAIAAHREAVEFTKTVSGLLIKEKVDGIVVNSYPMDINFKQSMKGVGNSIPALKEGGVVMAFLRAERGLDDITPPSDSKPLWLAKMLLRALGPAKVLWLLEKTKKGLNEEEKFLVYYSMQLIRAYELYFYVPTLRDEEVKRLGFFENFREPQLVIERAKKRLGKHAKVAVFAQAGATFPIV